VAYEKKPLSDQKDKETKKNNPTFKQLSRSLDN